MPIRAGRPPGVFGRFLNVHKRENVLKCSVTVWSCADDEPGAPGRIGDQTERLNDNQDKLEGQDDSGIN